MRLGAIIRAEKSDIKIGDWGRGHLPPSQFALRAKASSFKFGPQYEWVVIRFAALGERFRVLVLLNEAKQIYRAHLAIETATEMRLLCVHEFHASEPGWHCHAIMETGKAPMGWRRNGMLRQPHGVRIHDAFATSKDHAIRIALKVYRIESHGSLL